MTGRPICEKTGFRQVGELLELDLRRFRVEVTFVMAKMAYTPIREENWSWKSIGSGEEIEERGVPRRRNETVV